MKLEFTTHFDLRIGERWTDVDHIKRAIRNPDSKISQSDGGQLVTKKVDGKTIEVAYVMLLSFNKGYKYLVKTAYYI